MNSIYVRSHDISVFQEALKLILENPIERLNLENLVPYICSDYLPLSQKQLDLQERIVCYLRDHVESSTQRTPSQIAKNLKISFEEVEFCLELLVRLLIVIYEFPIVEYGSEYHYILIDQLLREQERKAALEIEYQKEYKILRKKFKIPNYRETPPVNFNKLETRLWRSEKRKREKLLDHEQFTGIPNTERSYIYFGLGQEDYIRGRAETKFKRLFFHILKDNRIQL